MKKYLLPYVTDGVFLGAIVFFASSTVAVYYFGKKSPSYLISFFCAVTVLALYALRVKKKVSALNLKLTDEKNMRGATQAMLLADDKTVMTVFTDYFTGIGKQPREENGYLVSGENFISWKIVYDPLTVNDVIEFYKKNAAGKKSSSDRKRIFGKSAFVCFRIRRQDPTDPSRGHSARHQGIRLSARNRPSPSAREKAFPRLFQKFVRQKKGEEVCLIRRASSPSVEFRVLPRVVYRKRMRAGGLRMRGRAVCSRSRSERSFCLKTFFSPERFFSPFPEPRRSQAFSRE